MRGESWKLRCQQCLARSGKERTRKLVETEYACIVEVDESTRQRLEGTLHQDHEDHVAGKGINSLNHYNLVHKGRVVLRGDIVKDDSGPYAVFTEQGSSASQMTAAKIMDIISRLPGCAGQAADAVSAYTQVKM